MTDSPAPWILIGGASRAARAIAGRVQGTVISVVRSPAGLSGEYLVGDFVDGPGNLPLAGATIVNCAGTPFGSADELDRANLQVPLAWARDAARQGAARFVQISSFSLFGMATRINDETKPAPVSDYGRSKLAAEQALIEAMPADRLTILRVPILIGGGKDKLAQLVNLAKRTRFVPAAPWQTRRSMLSYDGLAVAVIEAVRNDRNGVIAAADPQAFEPALLAARAQETGSKVRVATVPSPVLSILERLAPGIHASLFQPNYLVDGANVLTGAKGYQRLPEVIDRYL